MFFSQILSRKRYFLQFFSLDCNQENPKTLYKLSLTINVTWKKEGCTGFGGV